jgi:hypothetical protein
LIVPDYVFKKDYKTTDLYDLRREIEEKGHLPGIPSSEEIKKSGLDMTDLQLRTLEKVEELTLHTIRQQELIDMLIDEIAAKQSGANEIVCASPRS